jgi:hypothetical protein
LAAVVTVIEVGNALKADIERPDLKCREVPLTSDLRLDAPQQSSLRYSMRPAAAYAI